MNVTLEDAYAEACKALGEMTVTNRLLSAELARVNADLGALRAEVDVPTNAPEGAS